MDAQPQQFVAVVEDDQAVLDSLEFVLQAHGRRVGAFARPAQALADPEILDADCLIVDYRLPGIDGLSLLATLRSRGLTCPAIVIASNPTAHCRAEAAKAGAPLLEKPLIGSDLEGTVREVLRRAARAER